MYFFIFSFFLFFNSFLVPVAIWHPEVDRVNTEQAINCYKVSVRMFNFTCDSCGPRNYRLASQSGHIWNVDEVAH